MSGTPTLPAQPSDDDIRAAQATLLAELDDSYPRENVDLELVRLLCGTALASGATQPSEAIMTWQQRAEQEDPDGNPKHWPISFKAIHMAAEITELRAVLAATAAPTESEPTDDEIISLARIASASNNYEGGRFVSGNFNREDLIAFARGLLVRASLPPHPTGGTK